MNHKTKFGAIIPIFLILAATALIIRKEIIRIEVRDNSQSDYSAAFSNFDGAANAIPEKTATLLLDCRLSSSVKSALLKDLKKEVVFFEKNSESRWSIASLTKLMTAVVAIEKIGVNREVAISEKAGLIESFAGDFKPKEVFKAYDLIQAMLTVSSNDAALSLAETIGEKEFVKLMNQKAQELGMTETIFFNSSGLSFLNQSTVHDLAILTNYIYENHPEIFEISRQKEIKSLGLLSINQFAGRKDFLGGKSGYLESAGRNLISLFKKNNKVILIIVLGDEDAYQTTENLLKCIDNI